jgi:Flp pilus assembly protein TadB
VVWNGWPVLVLAGLVAGAVAPIWYRLGRLGKRTLEFREDLAAAVDLLQAQLFTGQGLVGALRALGEQGPARLQGEFRLLYQDVSLHGLEPAFRRAQARLEDAQFDLVAEALITADRAGGGAGKVLETLASSIRANLHLTRQIRAEQTRHIFSARVGAVWPLVILTFLKLSGSDYVAVFDTLPGQAALLLSLSLMLAGYLVMRVMGRIRPERRNF